MEMKVGDDVAAGPSRLGYNKHLTAYPTAKVTCATRASPAPAYITCAHSLHTSEAKMRMRIPSKMLNLGMGLD